MDDSKYGRWKIGGEKAWVELQAENGVFVTGLGNDQVGNLSPEWRRSFLLVNGAPVDVKKVERSAGTCKLEFGFNGGTGELEPAPCDAIDGAVHIFSNGSKDQYVLAHAELYGAAGIRTCRPKNLKRGQRVRLTDIEREFSQETVYDPKEGLKLPPTASVSFYDMEARQ